MLSRLPTGWSKRPAQAGAQCKLTGETGDHRDCLRATSTWPLTLGDLEEEICLAGDPLQVVAQFVLHSPLRSHTDAVDHREQEIDEAVCHLLLAYPAEGGQQCHPEGSGMAPQLMHILGRRAPSIRLQDFGRHVREQIRRQVQDAEPVQRGNLIDHTVQRGGTRVGAPAPDGLIPLPPRAAAHRRGAVQRLSLAMGRRELGGGRQAGHRVRA